MTTVAPLREVLGNFLDETDLDHDCYHGREGIVQQVRTDDAAKGTGRAIDSIEYKVRIEELDEEMRFRVRDVRPRS